MRVAGIAVLLLFHGASLNAQTLQPEVRADVLGPPPYSGGPGIGATMALGYYVRLNAGVGYELPLETGRTGDRWRAEVLARATFDPFRQQRWALSIGGGLTHRRSNTYLAAIVDVEGPELRGLLPALQIGVSGGLRAGLVLRRAVPGRR
jgi:hypothetical protein